ncbi:GAF domain-containing protein [Acinetobacter rathckeae]|uniref:GAF domain-containing protein n=1 Tax=Acinetobacter rathckeae TaxID=2605272 RepID=UPI0018A26C2A|nr:GAF domain-containing protein [Acinetobacter rathckeae]MBF7688214.1 GAF domain-containing protein [Acinetobacter rathckeae]MBF7695267.1 GAF domain-containing protein [Acinetobacter rathckeae]
MAEHLNVVEGDKIEQYENILPQIRGLIDGESDLIANLANVAAALKSQFDWLWVGFYLVKSEELVLGPFQGPIACTRIAYGRGVCGTAWQKQEVLIVDDVEQFKGHIACSSEARSEIVLPIFSGQDCIGVLDIDSAHLATFDAIDEKYLRQVVALLA